MVLDRLREILGDRLDVADAVREHHARDESHHPAAAPDAVAFPNSTEEVAAIVAACAAERTPVIAFGAGTALEGHVQAVGGGICVSTERMDRIVDVRDDDLDVTVQAGVRRVRLNEHLRDHGLFFPVDPGADATLGGMAATSASGTNAVRYGTMRDNVLSATVVLADGRIIRSARRARKSVAGYDLTRLFVGSEGTLGIITELTVRVYGVPEVTAAAVCSFEDIGSAARVVIEAMQLGVPVSRIELLDENQIRACNTYSDLSHAEAPTLFIEFAGSDASVAEDARTVGEIAASHGGSEFTWARDQAERERLWTARHSAYYAALATRPGSRGFVTDVCVPLSRLADCIVETKADLATCHVPHFMVAHAGDGNMHFKFAIDPDDPDELKTVRSFHDRLVERALSMDGTITGEHGIGMGKIEHLRTEHGPAIDVMRAIKEALDPDGILNPGKIL